MAETAIEWTQATWNPIVGCTIVSPGCTNCYAMKMARRLELMGTVAHYAGLTKASKAGPVWTGKLALAPERTLLEPLRRKKPTTYFVNSMGDLFHEDVPDEWIDRVVAVMALAELLHLCPPHPEGRDKHIFQVLTKRADRMRSYLRRLPDRDDIVADEADQIMGGNLPVELLVAVKRLVQRALPNVWLGVSAEDQKRADERIPELLATPAAIRFVSAEPLLGPIDFGVIPTYLSADCVTVIPGRMNALNGAQSCYPTGHRDGRAMISMLERERLDWIIVGGESGPNARPMHPAWARQIRDQCAAANTPFFFKQWGEWSPGDMSDDEAHRLYRQNRYAAIGGDQQFTRTGKKRAGRLLDGVEHNAMPEDRA